MTNSGSSIGNFNPCADPIASSSEMSGLATERSSTTSCSVKTLPYFASAMQSLLVLIQLLAYKKLRCLMKTVANLYKSRFSAVDVRNHILDGVAIDGPEHLYAATH